MDFKEDKFMVVLALIVVAFVTAQAVFFLVRAIKRAKELGIEKSTIKGIVGTVYRCARHRNRCYGTDIGGRSRICVAVDKAHCNR